MHRIDSAGADDGSFVDRNPSQGIPGTVVAAEWLNATQEELAQILESNGIDLDKESDNQVAQLLEKRLFSEVVESVDDLRAGSWPPAVTRLWLSGYYGVGTAGGGPLYRDSDDTTTADNGGTVLVDGDGVRWKRPDKSIIVPEEFGAVRDGTTDDSPALKGAIVYQKQNGGTIYLRAGSYRVANLPLHEGISIKGENMHTSLLRPLAATDTILTVEDEQSSRWRDISLMNFGLVGDSKGSGTSVDFRQLQDGIVDSVLSLLLFEDLEFGVRGSQNDRVFPVDKCRFVMCTNGYEHNGHHPYIRGCSFTDCDNGHIIVASDVIHAPFEHNVYLRGNKGIAVSPGGRLYKSRVNNCRFTFVKQCCAEVSDDVQFNDCEWNPPLPENQDGTVAVRLVGGNQQGITVNGGTIESLGGRAFDGAFFDLNGATPNDISFTNVTVTGAVGKLFDVSAPGNYSAYNISGNTFRDLTETIINFSGEAQLSHSNIANNIFWVNDSDLSFDIIKINESNFGNIYTGNTFVKPGGTGTGYALSVDARDAIITNNKIRGTEGIEQINSNANTVESNNVLS